MNIVSNVKDWKDIRANLKNKTIGFVPTMGHLHAGHMGLCDRARNENDIVVVSIFVNATQFNQATDFERYPRTLAEDMTLMSQHHVDYVFAPEHAELYPDQYQVQLTETDISCELEGEYRPGHFNGMLTVVLKLLNLMQANRAYFGEKDYQQLLLIQKMIKALFLPVEIIGCKTSRAEDGLALSSRNSRLTAVQRELAKQFPKLLQSDAKPDDIAQQLEQLGFKVDYISDKWQRRLGAVWVDDVRLIDNVER